MIETHFLQLGLTVLSLVGLVVVNRTSHKIMVTLAAYKGVDGNRVFYIQQFFKTIAFIVLLIVLSAIWGVDYDGLFLFATSILAVLGVALFAQWSLLSNVTSSVILFFSFPARIGDKIEIIDGANVITGTILEINVFQMLLRDEKGYEVSYPNSLILQRPVRKLSATKSISKDKKPSALNRRMQNRL